MTPFNSVTFFFLPHCCVTQHFSFFKKNVKTRLWALQPPLGPTESPLSKKIAWHNNWTPWRKVGLHDATCCMMLDTTSCSNCLIGALARLSEQVRQVLRAPKAWPFSGVWGMLYPESVFNVLTYSEMVFSAFFWDFSSKSNLVQV